MALKLDANMSATAHHIIDGPVVFPYAIDAHSAVSRFPNEWSMEPWPLADTEAAMARAGHAPIDITPEEQAAIDEHAKAVELANERLKAFREEKAKQKAIDDQAAADEALIASPAPRPDFNARRKPGRPTKT